MKAHEPASVQAKSHDRRYAPATARNRDPILEVLRRVLPVEAVVLEIASGSGEHVVHFAAALPAVTFLPSDPDPAALRSTAAWISSTGVRNCWAPVRLDVSETPWPLGSVDAIFCANMIHIAPFEACEALMRGAGAHLAPGGALVLYGPFRIGGQHTATSNAAFDADLRARDPRFGVRDLEVVAQLAEASGLTLAEQVEMPANNLTLVFRRR